MIVPTSGKMKRAVAVFLLPSLLIYCLFAVIPLIQAFYFSAFTWHGIAGSKMLFVGLKNYRKAFTNPAFLLSLKNLATFLVISVAFHTPIALLFAVFLNAEIKGKRIYKAVFFIPTILPLTAIGLMWYFVFMPQGALNVFLTKIGLEQLARPWLTLQKTAMPTISVVNVWAGIGYYMVILLAGLTSIDESVYEAATIDGASKVQQFWYVTVPMMKATIVMCVIMDIIGTVKIFDLVFAMTGGGPNGMTHLPTTLLYDETFKYRHFGYGSALGIIILGICLVLTFATNAVSRKMGGEDA